MQKEIFLKLSNKLSNLDIKREKTSMQIKKKTSKTVLSEINVTPFVDVMLVLLIVFMVTAPLLQQGIDVQIPETASGGLPITEKPFVLKIKKNKAIFFNKTRVQPSQVRKKLKSIFKTRRNKQIYIQADERVSYGFVAKVMAEVKGAGISGIGLMTRSGNGF